MAMMSSKVHSPSKRPSILRALGALTLGASIAVFSASCTKKADDKDTTLNVVLKANVKGLDPILANDFYVSTVTSQIYEGLLQYHYLKRPYALQPSLAESMPAVSSDGLTVTFKIKKGVKFHDNPAFPDGKGREVTAEDFIYSWRRLADPRNIADGFWVFDGKIKGLNEWGANVKAGKADYSTPIEGLKAPDKNTLVITLTQPYYQLNYVLAMSFTAVHPREAVDKYGQEFLNNPVGTGPFMLVKATDWVRNSKMTLKRNPNYRQELYPTEGEPADPGKGLLSDAGKQVPFSDTLVIHEIVEDQPRWQNIAKGNLEFAELPNDNFKTAIAGDNVTPELAKKGMYVDRSPAVEVTFIAFNMTDPVLGKNKDLRHAMSLAIDMQKYMREFKNPGTLQAHGPIPIGIDGYDPNYKNPYGEFSVAKAKEFLAKAGYPEGKGLPELTYEILSDSKSRQEAEFHAASWAAIGVKVKLNANTWPQRQEKIKNGQFQMFGLAWIADYPDAQNFLQLFYTKNKRPGPNDSNYSNPEFDQHYEKALTLPPGPERTALYHKMRDIVVEDTPWIFSLTRTDYYLANGWLKNFKYNQITSDWFKYLRVDPKKRAELKPRM